MARTVGFVVTALLVLFVWGLWAFQPLIQPYIAERFGFQWDLQKSGLWGDTFGALNTLFGSLGLLAVLATLLQQQKQIKATQDDQHRARFENSYFELLRLLREARNDLRFKHSDEFAEAKSLEYRELTKGQPALKTAWIEARHWIKRSEHYVPRERAGELYVVYVHSRFENTFGTYFRILYTILTRIRNDSVLSSEEKHRYITLLKMQLGTYEVATIALNGLSPVSGNSNALITEFGLLSHLPEGPRKTTLSQYYSKEAFVSHDYFAQTVNR